MKSPDTLIFDLSEVFIAGLKGIEPSIAARLSIDEASVSRGLNCLRLQELFRGSITEDAYLQMLHDDNGWAISTDDLKQIIRRNFHYQVPGMDDLLPRLRDKYRIFLLSDHAREWIEYIRTIHPFLEQFHAQFYSCELKQTKRDPSTFSRVLASVQRDAADCIFVDDSERNVAAALSAGIPSIHFVSAAQLQADLRQMGIL